MKSITVTHQCQPPWSSGVNAFLFFVLAAFNCFLYKAQEVILSHTRHTCPLPPQVDYALIFTPASAKYHTLPASPTASPPALHCTSKIKCHFCGAREAVQCRVFKAKDSGRFQIWKKAEVGRSRFSFKVALQRFCLW